MPVIRKEIRHAIVNLMKNIPGVTVYSSRVYPISELPSISVYTTEELVDEELITMAGDDTKRIVSVSIDIINKASIDLDDSLDDIAYLVEQEISANNDLNGLVSCLQYSETTTELSADSEMAVGVSKLTYIATN